MEIFSSAENLILDKKNVEKHFITFSNPLSNPRDSSLALEAREN